MNLSIHQTLLGLVAGLVFLQGCATNPVADADRDDSGDYDGRWQVQVLKGPVTQYVQSWVFTCNADAYEFNMRVRDGRVYIGGVGGGKEQITNVDGDGRFAFVIPLEGDAQASGNSAKSIELGSRRWKMNGNLSDSSKKGVLTIGIQQFGWQGCTTKVRYQRA